ncbi:MAG: hypothetical protein NT062_01400 [Proteobacteria bacterium]|nr:hypothetical protein [Pseudomonadota bacterium]
MGKDGKNGKDGGARRPLAIRQYFFELLALALIAGSLFFFKETLDYLARRDYIAALLVMVIGVAVISVGKEMARLALVQRD